jgi:hypothetical protein
MMGDWTSEIEQELDEEELRKFERLEDLVEPPCHFLPALIQA